MTEVIHLISGPRNISTALMYAFGNRGDCSIVDEPLYAHYLSNHDANHPGRADIINSMSSNLTHIKAEVFEKPYLTDYVFVKNMAHHFIGINHAFVLDYRNVFLIRDPKQLIHSFSKVIDQPSMQDIGLKKEYELFSLINNESNMPVVVIDSNEILKDPKKTLTELCRQIGIPFSNKMLAWPAGPRKEDGIWAKYWYANVHKSTCFSRTHKKEAVLLDSLMPLYEEAKYYYDKLYIHAIKA